MNFYLVVDIALLHAQIQSETVSVHTHTPALSVRNTMYNLTYGYRSLHTAVRCQV
jgi:hypothetical protein